jgi:hypothetical protein
MAGGTVTISGGNVIHTFTSSGYLTPIKYVNNSLRFRSSASAYLSRTPATTSNRKTWTWSGWLKLGAIGQWEGIFNAGSSGNQFAMYLYTDNLLYIQDYTGANNLYLQTSQVFRDPSAWYHIVIAIDTTQATSTNRAKLYVNGVQVTAFVSTTYPSQNYDTQVNSNSYQHDIGLNYQFGTSNPKYFDGYMAEVQFVDGYQLTPNSFGTFNSYGVWQPITYGGSYGTNGFYLPFSNTASATTLAYDFSPNGNNWTPNNISSTTSPTSIQVFTSSTTWTAPIGVSSVNYLVVAGGGGSYIAGGGAGGYRTGTLSVTSGTSYTVTVGAGGGQQNNGSDSVFSSITSLGGGGAPAGGAGNSGGSGGGGSYGSAAGGAGTGGQGNNGGSGSSNAGGGGGGAGGAGSNAPSAQNGGNGGNGTTVSSALGGGTYAGGGGGGATTAGGSVPGTGGSGGGGAGSRTSTSYAGTANTGGGAGGNASGLAGGANGGSGIVIVSYTVDSMTDVPTLTSATAANYCVGNPLNNTAGYLTISGGNLNVSCGAADKLAFGTFALPTSGKWYFEYLVSSTGSATQIGLGDNTQSQSSGTGFSGGNQKFGSGGSWANSDIAGVAIDMDAGTGTIYKNNSSYLSLTSLSGTTWYPCVYINSASGSFNFGQQPFVYTPPTGYLRLNTYNL